MSVPAEFTRFPAHWDVLPFTKAVRDATSGNVKIQKAEYSETGEIPIVDQGQSLFGGYTDDTSSVCKSELPTIVFGDHTRAFKYLETRFALGADGTKVLEPKANLDKRFLFHYLKRLRIESAGYSRHYKFLKETYVPVPPLSDQKRIAAILDKADTIRRKRHQAIQLADEFLRAVFLDMFGDPVTNPKGFSVSSIGKECKVKGGKRIPKGKSLVNYDTGFPYIKAGNIKNGKVTLDKLEYVTPEVRDKINRYTVEKGDLCITVVGVNIGDVGVVPPELDKASLTENANKILINDKERLSTIYLCEALKTDFIQNQIKKKTMAVGVPKLALFRIEEMEILVPPRDLQSKFEKIVSLINSHISKLKSSGENSYDLFQSLSQKAFKGQL